MQGMCDFWQKAARFRGFVPRVAYAFVISLTLDWYADSAMAPR